MMLRAVMMMWTQWPMVVMLMYPRILRHAMKWNIMRQSWNEKKISKSLKECWITQIKLVQFYKQKLNAQASTATVSEEDIELDNTIKNAITSTIATNQKFSRYGSNCKGQLIFVALFSEELLNGCCLPFLIGNAKS
jgi:hypothetical protein